MPAAKAQPKRKDPRKRRPSNAFDQTVIEPETKEPGRVYRFASLNAHYMGVRQMEQLGWRIEIQGESPVKLRIGATAREGEPLEYMGNILMSVEKEEADRANREGWYGEGGQDDLDMINQRIRKDGSVTPLAELQARAGAAAATIVPLTDKPGAASFME